MFLPSYEALLINLFGRDWARKTRFFFFSHLQTSNWFCCPNQISSANLNANVTFSNLLFFFPSFFLLLLTSISHCLTFQSKLSNSETIRIHSTFWFPNFDLGYVNCFLSLHSSFPLPKARFPLFAYALGRSVVM